MDGALDDLAVMLALARSHVANGKPPKYLPALDLAYAQTLVHLAEHWMPKPKTIIHTPSDAETRIEI